MRMTSDLIMGSFRAVAVNSPIFVGYHSLKSDMLYIRDVSFS